MKREKAVLPASFYRIKGILRSLSKDYGGFLYSLEDLFECFFTILIGDGHNTGDFFKYM